MRQMTGSLSTTPLEYKDLVKSQKSIRRKVLGKKETYNRQSRYSSHGSGNASTGRKRWSPRMKSTGCRLVSASACGIHGERGKRPASHTSQLPSPPTWCKELPSGHVTVAGQAREGLQRRGRTSRGVPRMAGQSASIPPATGGQHAASCHVPQTSTCESPALGASSPALLTPG